MSSRALAGLFRKALAAWSDDYAPSMGAALAYYTLFSLAPFLVVVIAIAGLVFGPEAARGEVVSQLRDLMGEDGAAAVQALLASASRPGSSVLASMAGLTILFVGATSVFAELQSSLDRIWRAPALKHDRGVWALVRARILSFGMVVSIGFLLLVSLVTSAILAALGRWSAGFFSRWETVLELANLAVGFGITTLLFALIYRILPRVRVAWRDVWIGAAVTALLFNVGKLAIGLYLGKAGLASGFGAAGSLVALLAWVYYSAQIFLLGAEFTWVFAHNHGSRAGERREHSATVPTRSGAGETGTAGHEPGRPAAARVASPAGKTRRR